MTFSAGQLFIGGHWAQPRSRSTITVASASTGKEIGSVAAAGPADVDDAVLAARRAFDDPSGWSAWTAPARAAALNRFAEALSSRGPQIAETVSAQNGMPITVASMIETQFPAAMLRYYAGLIEARDPEVTQPGSFGGTTHILQEPVGVVAAIAPWNFPQTLATQKYAPALAAGCTVVLKPSPETVLDTGYIAEAALEAGLPDGVLNIVPGANDTGAYLVTHPGVDKVAFTGSTATGRRIAEGCGRLLKPVTLELGGKSAAVFLDDAELDLAKVGQALFGAMLINNGQTCFLSTRILAPASRYREAVDTIAALASSLIVGDALDSSTQIGPMASERHRERVEGYIAQGKHDGARVVAGGGRPKDLDAGWFVEPTVFADVENSWSVAREEIFGPVLTITPYDTVEDAIRIANDSPYGLAGSVWSADPQRALGVARRMRTGSVGINGYLPDLAAPFGGVKDSGIGRELGPAGLAGYQVTKSIYEL
jgi:acyl-CoA reductase-like NAD-dependent aldehyde dehydrogenase